MPGRQCPVTAPQRAPGEPPGTRAGAHTTSETTHLPAQTRVLVVEDDESHALAVGVGLEREGFSVVSVADGPSALSAISEMSPDVVLLDVMLPGLAGIDVCRRIREEGSSIPVIMVSARSEELDVVVAMEVGADDYVAKPYRMRELVARTPVRIVTIRGLGYRYERPDRRRERQGPDAG